MRVRVYTCFKLSSFHGNTSINTSNILIVFFGNWCYWSRPRAYVVISCMQCLGSGVNLCGTWTLFVHSLFFHCFNQRVTIDTWICFGSRTVDHETAFSATKTKSYLIIHNVGVFFIQRNDAFFFSQHTIIKRPIYNQVILF